MQFLKRVELASLSQNQHASDLKRALIQYGPLFSGYPKVSDPSHAMTLVGYNTFHPGDTVYRYQYADGYQTFQLIGVLTPQDSAYIGRSYWIFKNSYAGMGNDILNGYKYIHFYDQFLRHHPQQLLLARVCCA